MTLLKDNNYKDINVALLSLEADIKNKITGFDTSEIDKQLAEINSRIDKINAGGGNNSSDEIEDINSKLNSNSIKIRNIEQNIESVNTQINGIEQKLSDIFSAENKVTDFNATTNSGVYYWIEDAANKPANYGVLLVNKYDGGSSLWINQVAYGTNSKIYFRQNINSGSWTEWKAVAFEGELNADTVDNYHASQLWRSDGATWNPNANVTMTPSGNGDEWSFDFGNKNGATGTYWQVWDENKQTLLRVDADSGKVSAPYGFVGNLSGKADTAGTAGKSDRTTGIDYTGESGSCISATQTPSSYNNSSADWASYIICNHGNGTTYYHQMLRLPFFSDTIQLQRRVNGELQGWKNVAIMENENTWSGRQNFTTAKASNKMVIPIGAPSSLEDGCIWIS